MLNYIKKKLSIPSGEEKQIDAYESWIVRWVSYQKSYTLANLKDEVEIFPTEELALEFKKQLERAFILTKSTVSKITVTKNTY